MSRTKARNILIAYIIGYISMLIGLVNLLAVSQQASIHQQALVSEHASIACSVGLIINAITSVYEYFEKQKSK